MPARLLAALAAGLFLVTAAAAPAGAHAVDARPGQVCATCW